MMPVVLARFACTAMAQPTESSVIDPPAGPGAMAPNLSTVDDGVVLTWLEPVEREPTTGRDDHRRRRARRCTAAWRAARLSSPGERGGSGN